MTLPCVLKPNICKTHSGAWTGPSHARCYSSGGLGFPDVTRWRPGYCMSVAICTATLFLSCPPQERAPGTMSGTGSPLEFYDTDSWRGRRTGTWAGALAPLSGEVKQLTSVIGALTCSQISNQNSHFSIPYLHLSGTNKNQLLFNALFASPLTNQGTVPS